MSNSEFSFSTPLQFGNEKFCPFTVVQSANMLICPCHLLTPFFALKLGACLFVPLKGKNLARSFSHYQTLCLFSPRLLILLEFIYKLWVPCPFSVLTWCIFCIVRLSLLACLFLLSHHTATSGQIPDFGSLHPLF